MLIFEKSGVRSRNPEGDGYYSGFWSIKFHLRKGKLVGGRLHKSCILLATGFWLLAPSSKAQTVTLSAVGDILLDRGVAKQIQAHGTDYPFQLVAPQLQAADIAFGNLECPIAERGQKVVKPFVFKAPPGFAPCLNAGGFDILSCANNHTLDCGRVGLQETMAALRQRNIQWCGAGETRNLAEKPAVLQVRGLKVAFVGFCEFVPEGVFLNDEKPSIALADENRVRAALQKARTQADILVASFHWGIEYQNRPSVRQKLLARVAAQAGADLVLGHHPHVLQGLEVLRGPQNRRCVVAYSLGNFLFDAPSRFVADTRDTTILQCALDKTGVRSVQFVPVQIENYRPKIAKGQAATNLLAQLSKLCAELGTTLKKGAVAW